MFTRYDKAGAAVLVSGLGAVVGQLTGLDETTPAALVAILITLFVFLVPNREVRS